MKRFIALHNIVPILIYAAFFCVTSIYPAGRHRLDTYFALCKKLTETRAPRPGTDTGDASATGNTGNTYTPVLIGDQTLPSDAIFNNLTVKNYLLVEGHERVDGSLDLYGTTTHKDGSSARFEMTGDPTKYIELHASPATTVASSWALPPNNGLAGQILSTDGAGTLSWTDAGTATGAFTNGGNAFGTTEAVLGSTNALDLVIRTGVGTLPGQARMTLAAAGQITINNGNELRFEKTGDATKWVGFKANAATSINNVWTLPADNGSANQFLTTDGAGTLSWTNSSGSVGHKAGAYLSSNIIVGASPLTIVFDTISFTDGNYNNATGIYTVPTAGTYLVTAQLCVQIGNSGTKKINLFKGAAAIPGCTGKLVVPTFSYSTTDTDTYTIPLTTMVNLALGDQVKIVYTGDAADTIIGDGSEFAIHFMSI